ncbi:MAG: calcium/sodium antiporter [Gammaproteobacteria bacterium]|nr:calcium/sodium antiporter [Gammaproteobacteria bacterium]
MIAFAGVCLGVLLLIGGGAFLVRGASEIASAHGVSPMVVGLTIVGFGTSAPELVVNVIGAIHGETALAFGNVIGSNISNLGLVLGLAAIITPMTIQGNLVRRELPLLLLATTVITVLALDGPLEGNPATIGRTDSIVLILMFCIFIYITAHDFLRTKRIDPLLIEIEEHPIAVLTSDGRMPLLLLFAGFALLFVGGETTIRNGVALAAHFGTSPTIIGLFVVAIGTSMPELATSIIAAMRGESDLALGNVIGSNIFNSLLVLPTSGLISQIAVPAGGVGDLVVSWVLAAVLIPVFFIGKARLGRTVGLILLLAYCAYALLRILGAPA